MMSVILSAGLAIFKFFCLPSSSKVHFAKNHPVPFLSSCRFEIVNEQNWNKFEKMAGRRGHLSCDIFVGGQCSLLRQYRYCSLLSALGNFPLRNRALQHFSAKSQGQFGVSS